MDKISVKTGVTAYFALAVFALSFSHAYAVTFKVNCDKGNQTINKALADAVDGDTINVSGTCNEAITIILDNLILDGGGTAEIIAPAGSGRDAVLVRASNVLITGFSTITGENRGIQVERSGSAVITNNTVENSGSHGISISGASSARLENNTVKNNGSHGIRVTNSSFARIEPGNIVMANGGHGIIVHRSSAARIFRNTITDNINSVGILVTSSGSADINENIIEDNVGDGISVNNSSSIRLAQTRFIATGNTLKRNGRFGVRCRGFGSLDVRVVQVFGTGTDANASGATSIGTDCALSNRPPDPNFPP